MPQNFAIPFSMASKRHGFKIHKGERGMRGKKTSPKKYEEIKALALTDNPATIAQKTGTPLRTVYDVLRRRDDPKIEAVREKKREEIVEEVWKDKEKDMVKLKGKMDLILEAIDEGTVERAKLVEKTTAYGTLFDKLRLLDNKSTANVGVLAVIIREALEKV
jgi:hypothetical protein